MDRQWLMRLSLVLAVFVNNANFSATTVVLPSVQHSLGLGFTGLQWTMTAYLVTYAAFMLPGGRLSDVTGVRAVLVTGVLTYIAALGIVASAPALPELLAGRALQGVAAAMITPTTTSAARTRFTGAAQTAAIGMVVGMSAIGQAAGPLLGGLIDQGIGWRAVFGINIPLLAVAAVLTLVTMKPDPRPVPAGRVDLLGAALLTGALALLTIALTESGNYGLASPGIVGLLAAAAVMFAALVLWVRGRRDALLDAALFRSQTFLASTLVGFTMTFTFAGILFFEALYLERVRGYGVIETGLLFLPMTALFAGLSLQAARIQRHFGARLPAVTGLAVASAGSVVLALDRPAAVILQPLAGLFLIGLGLGASWTNVTSTGLRTVPAGQAGQAAGILFTARWIGGAIGIATLGLVYRSAAAAHLNARLAALGLPAAHHRYDQLDGLLSGLAPARTGLALIPAQARAVVSEAIRDAASQGTAWALAGVAIVAALGALLCLLFQRDPRSVTGCSGRRRPALRPGHGAGS